MVQVQKMHDKTSSKAESLRLHVYYIQTLLGLLFAISSSIHYSEGASGSVTKPFSILNIYVALVQKDFMQDSTGAYMVLCTVFRSV